MSQSSFIAAALLGGFVLFLAAKGRLPTYTGILWGPAPAKGNAGATTAPPQNTSSNSSSADKNAQNLADILKALNSLQETQ